MKSEEIKLSIFNWTFHHLIKVLQLHMFGLRKVLSVRRHIQTIEPCLLSRMARLKNKIFVVIKVYRANTLLCIRITVYMLNSDKSFFLIATFALSVPNRKPSGRITAARPFCLRRYMMTDINRSAVSELAKSARK